MSISDFDFLNDSKFKYNSYLENCTDKELKEYVEDSKADRIISSGILQELQYV